MPRRQYDVCGDVVDRYDIHLLHDAGILAEHAKGSSELPYGAPEKIKQALLARLQDWDPSAEWEKVYDEAVRNLCEKAIALYEWRMGASR